MQITLGPGEPSFNLDDEAQFKAYCAYNFGLLIERTKDLPELTKKVPVLEQEVKDIREDMRDEKFWTNVKSLSGASVAVLHGVLHLFGIKKF